MQPGLEGCNDECVKLSEHILTYIALHCVGMRIVEWRVRNARGVGNCKTARLSSYYDDFDHQCIGESDAYDTMDHKGRPCVQ